MCTFGKTWKTFWNLTESGEYTAGGVLEVKALSVWVLLSACVTFDGGAPRSSDAARSTSLSSRVSESCDLLRPRPDPCRRRIWSSKYKWKMVMANFAMDLEIQGVGSSEPLSGDFPLAMGLAPAFQGLRSSGRGAPPARSGLPRGRDPEEEEEDGLLCNFWFSSVSFCKNEV